jgi:mRNA interferase MazF
MTNSPINPKTGEVVIADLGFAAKTRPCLVLCERPDSQRTVTIVAPLTSETRGSETEISFPKPRWLAQDCVVNLSGLGAIERHRIERRLGTFPPERFEEARTVLAKMFGLKHPSAQPAA